MLERLSERLDAVIKKVSGRGRIRESDIKAAMREVRVALLEADVQLRVARDFVRSVGERAVGHEVLASVSPRQQLIKIVHDELTTLLGGEASDMASARSGGRRILMAGLQGSGKTTSAAKLALMVREAGRQPLLVAGDLKRPAAIEQLQTLARQVDVPIHSESVDSRPEHVARNGIRKAEALGCSDVIVDTAGRLQIDGELMDEVERIARQIDPTDILLVVDAMTGQEAVNVAAEFHRRLELTGLILTKLDGDARGGALLSIRAATGVPIKFIGMGEKIEPLERFHPDRLASRILGMGDVVTLVEKAQASIDSETAAQMEKKLRGANFDLSDFLQQIDQIENMGSLSQVASMIPGFSRLGNRDQLEAALSGREMDRTKAIILSMTPEERADPTIINGSRRRRIAAGSGTAPRDVNQLLNQFFAMRKMLRQMSRGRMPKIPGFSPFG